VRARLLELKQRGGELCLRALDTQAAVAGLRSERCVQLDELLAQLGAGGATPQAVQASEGRLGLPTSQPPA
jgi:hypothetical protein